MLAQTRTTNGSRTAFGSALRAVAMAVLISPLLVTLSAPSAEAASYRYWSYWSTSGSGAWGYSNVGAGSTRPANGSVQGWRFAVSAGASNSTITPRVAGNFTELCGATPPAPNRKRVGLVVDFGTANDAPRGEAPPASRTFCVDAPAKASGAAVLLQALSVRSKDGLVCGINGYPRTECTAVIASPKTTPRTTSNSSPRATVPKRNGSGGSASSASSGRTANGSQAPPRATATEDADAATPPSSGRASPTQPPAANASTAPSTALPSPAATLVTDTAATDDGTGRGTPGGVLVSVLLLSLAAGSAFLLRRRSAQ